ncbi:MAG: bifunctional hydroxymethylpyrimidine kinase/phosphomethylpyrimidine kinase [Deltaproteobacteria bacterium]|nr:bifunctional hydroxymethylpyrimidine kinase/phosphomethylpyrimidine kinase [Deltaproteobacteria bacterium]
MKHLSPQNPARAHRPPKAKQYKEGAQKILALLGGIDPSGKAGLMADYQTCDHFGIAAHCLPTALTIQSDKEYLGHHTTPLPFFQQALDHIFNLQNLGAIKIGMMPSREQFFLLMQTLADYKKNHPDLFVVWDPVIKSSSGGKLAPDDVNTWLGDAKNNIDLITPNAEEACFFLNHNFNENLKAKVLAKAFWERFQIPVYLKGGHLAEQASDVLLTAHTEQELTGVVSKKKIRGTGCRLATAIACGVLKTGDVVQACKEAKEFMNQIFSKNHP